MKKGAAKTIFVLSFAILLLYIYAPDIERFVASIDKVRNQLQEETFPSIVEEIKNIPKPPVVTSKPLIAKRSSQVVVLSPEKIVKETNSNRSRNGVASLVVNAQLSLAAEDKAKDMIAKQYFAHESPEGNGPAEVIKARGYEYKIVGENLAMGIFKDENDLVNAWMESPGHRENILHKEFTEIGVAVVKGNFNGEEIIMAVQEFGAPLLCKRPDENLKITIDRDKALVEKMSADIGSLTEVIESSKGEDDYDELVESYNDLVRQYNKVLGSLKEAISNYNKSVRLFNECLEG